MGKDLEKEKKLKNKENLKTEKNLKIKRKNNTLIKEFLDFLEFEKGDSERTLIGYKRDLKQFLDFFSKSFDKILEEDVIEFAQHISKKLKENGIESLYEKKYIIQLTLYLTKYNMNNLHKIKEIIEKIANQTKSFNVEFYRLRKTDRKLLVLDAKNNENIQQLADEITVNLTKYHAKNINVPNWIKYIPEREKLFKLYGSSDVFTNFEPYIPLLSQVNLSQIQSFISKYNFNPFKSKAIGIGIAQVDDLGQAKNIIYSVKFKK